MNVMTFRFARNTIPRALTPLAVLNAVYKALKRDSYACFASTDRAWLSRGSKEVFLMSIHTQTNGQSCLSPEKRPPKASGFSEANSVVKSCNGDYANAPVTLTRKLLPLLRLSSI